jgi:serine/threonine protein kinase/tetratricopeptide (TPR) repeat protein
VASRPTPLTEERWQRLQALFLAAAELSSPERERFVERETAGDPSLQRELAGMLAHSGDAGRLIAHAIEGAALAVRPDSVWLGRRVGAYRLLHEIGRGGMGLVFEAARDDDEFRKMVAVKIAPPWHDAARFDEQFRQERQILAELEHPNIARLLDGGTADGVPYFVMELVGGEPITAYCERHHLDPAARIALFRQVCSAVRFAHESLVVHRDLKPSNILVTEDGTPKLLDFGIARLLDPLSERDATTTVGAAWTPDYTSPEQVRGRPVTTRTDVYSLGLILYELLTGERGQIADTTSLAALERSICEHEPPRPSERAVAHGRPADALRLRGDLDTIVLTAIRKEPERRYGSAAALSDDLGRYLDGRPIPARPSTARYRAGKFLNRHRVGVAAGALVVMAVAAGVVSTIYQARRAERRFQQVRALANAFVFDVHDRIETLPGSTAARKAIVQTALTYLESLRQDAAGDPALTRELGAAYFKIGTVQGVPARSNLGDTAGAVVSFTRAEELLGPLAARGDRDSGRQLVSVLASLGAVREVQGDPADMDAAWSRASALGEALLRTPPDDERLLAATAELYGLMARGESNRGRFDAAEAAARRAVDLSRRLLELSPENREYQDSLGSAYNTLGQVQHVSLRLGDALASFRSSAGIRERLVAEAPQNGDYRHNLIICYGNIADVLGYQPGRNLGDGPGAAAAIEKAVALAEAARAQDPQDRRALFDSVSATLRLGTIRTDALQDDDGALKDLDASDRLARRLIAEDPKNARYGTLVASIELKMGETLAHSGRDRPAVEQLEVARVAAEQLPPNSATRQNALTVTSLRLAEVKERLGDSGAMSLADFVDSVMSGQTLANAYNDALLRTDVGRLYARMALRNWPPGREALTAKAVRHLEAGLARWRVLKLAPSYEPRRVKETADAEADLTRLKAPRARQGS